MMGLREKYRGKCSGTYKDIFGLEWDRYPDSRIFFITNIGDKGKRILDWLKQYPEVVVISEKSIFKYIEVAVLKENTEKELREWLKTQLNCDLISEDC